MRRKIKSYTTMSVIFCQLTLRVVRTCSLAYAYLRGELPLWRGSGGGGGEKRLPRVGATAAVP